MRAHLSWVGVVGAALFASAGRANSPAFIEASSELDNGKAATSMWNAVDGGLTTSWCSTKLSSGKQAISFTFEEPVTVTQIGLLFAHSKEGTVDKVNKRPRIVYVADVAHRVEARFKDSSDMQVLELTPPAQGLRVVVEFEDTWPGATDDAPLCVAEVVLKNKNKELTAELAQKARSLNGPARKLLHQWHDDLSAPTRTLLFNVDGTFIYRFTPLMDDQKPMKLHGKWSAGSGTVTLDVNGKPYTLQTRFTNVADADDPHTELALSGEAPHPSMIETFKPAPLLLP